MIQLTSLVFLSMHRIRDRPIIPETAFFLYQSILKLLILSHYKFGFLHRDLNRKNNTRT